MTIKQFISKLECVDRDWSLIEGAITSDDELCPIHEVWLASSEGEEEGQLEDYFEEGIRLGLRKKTVGRIAAAADNRGYPQLRERLLKACGLSH